MKLQIKWTVLSPTESRKLYIIKIMINKFNYIFLFYLNLYNKVMFYIFVSIDREKFTEKLQNLL